MLRALALLGLSLAAYSVAAAQIVVKCDAGQSLVDSSPTSRHL